MDKVVNMRTKTGQKIASFAHAMQKKFHILRHEGYKNAATTLCSATSPETKNGSHQAAVAI
jgi:hypothetical protein